MSPPRARTALFAVAIIAGGLALAVLAAGLGLHLGRARGGARPGAPPPDTRASTPAALTVWVLGDSIKVRPGDALGEPHAPGAPVRLRGARGETVAFQMVLAALAGRREVELHWTDLAGAHAAIPRRRLSAFLETFLYCPSVEPKLVALPAGEYPDPLVPLGVDDAGPGASSFTLAPRRNQVVWIDVEIPRETPGGSYAGTLRIDAASQPRLTLGIEVQVYPFDLPARPSLVAWVPLYATRLWQRERLDTLPEAERRRVLHSYLRMAHAHRFVTQVMEQQPELRWDTGTGALLSADWGEYDADYGPALDGTLFEDGEPPRQWKVGGFVWWGASPGEPPHFGGDYRRDASLTPAHRRALGEYARALRHHFDEKGWTRPELFMYMIDEPELADHPSLATLAKDYGDALHAAGTGIRHLVTIAPHESPLAVGAVDIWTAWGAGYRPREMQARQRRGDQAWFYQQHEPFVGGHCVNDDGLSLRSWAWIAWRYRVDGVFLWVGNFWNEDPYRDVHNWREDDGQLGNGVLFYPGNGLDALGLVARPGPVSSFRMKALRRGLFDYEYFAKLRALGGDPDPIVRRVMRSALNEGEYEPYWKHPQWARPGDWSHDPAEWDRARDEIAQEILGLTGDGPRSGRRASLGSTGGGPRAGRSLRFGGSRG